MPSSRPSALLPTTMADRQSEKAFDLWRASVDQHDRFMLGVAMALVAYLGQHLSVASLGMNPATLEALSLLPLGGAVVTGILRVRYGATSLGAQHLRLMALERAGSLRAALDEGTGGPLLERTSGRVLDVATATREAEQWEAAETRAQTQVNRWTKRTEVAYSIRDWLLGIGVVAYVAAKAWGALAAG